MEKSKKKVLFLITKSNWGGAQRYVHDLAIGLPGDRFEVAVALGGDGPLAEKLREARIRVIPIPSLERDVSIIKDVVSFFDILAIARIERPDVFHINSSKAGIMGSLIGRLVGVRNIIFTAHGWAFNEDRPSWQRLIFKFVHWLSILLSHRTIAVSEEVKRQMDWPWAQEKMIVIRNGRNIKDQLNREEARAYLIEKEPSLQAYKDDLWTMTIAELHPVKRHEAVIDTIKKLTDQGEVFRHLIIGSGEQKEALRRQIERLELQDRVFLLGAIPEAATYLKAADVFVLASRTEAMPYAVIEALLSEVPTVATAVGGIPEVIENGVSGLLAPPLDNEALANILARLLRDEELRKTLADGARERRSELSFERTLESTINVYEPQPSITSSAL